MPPKRSDGQRRKRHKSSQLNSSTQMNPLQAQTRQRQRQRDENYTIKLIKKPNRTSRERKRVNERKRERERASAPTSPTTTRTEVSLHVVLLGHVQRSLTPAVGCCGVAACGNRVTHTHTHTDTHITPTTRQIEVKQLSKKQNTSCCTLWKQATRTGFKQRLHHIQIALPSCAVHGSPAIPALCIDVTACTHAYRLTHTLHTSTHQNKPTYRLRAAPAPPPDDRNSQLRAWQCCLASSLH